MKINKFVLIVAVLILVLFSTVANAAILIKDASEKTSVVSSDIELSEVIAGSITITPTGVNIPPYGEGTSTTHNAYFQNDDGGNVKIIIDVEVTEVLWLDSAEASVKIVQEGEVIETLSLTTDEAVVTTLETTIENCKNGDIFKLEKYGLYDYELDYLPGKEDRSAFNDRSDVRVKCQIEVLDVSGNIVGNIGMNEDTFSGSFTVKQNGDRNAKLNWRIDSKPDGWIVSPSQGEFTGYDVPPVVTVTINDIIEKSISGEIVVKNTQNSSQVETVSVTVQKSKAKQANSQMQFIIINTLIQKLFSRYPSLKAFF